MKKLLTMCLFASIAGSSAISLSAYACPDSIYLNSNSEKKVIRSDKYKEKSSVLDKAGKVASGALKTAASATFSLVAGDVLRRGEYEGSMLQTTVNGTKNLAVSAYNKTKEGFQKYVPIVGDFAVSAYEKTADGVKKYAPVVKNKIVEGYDAAKNGIAKAADWISGKLS